MAKLQYTDITNNLDVILEEDGTVFNNGVLMPDAVTSTYDGLVRIDIDGDGLLEIRSIPVLAEIDFTRIKGNDNKLLLYFDTLGSKLGEDGRGANIVSPSECAVSVLTGHTNRAVISTSPLFTQDGEGRWVTELSELDLSKPLTFSLWYKTGLYGKKQLHPSQEHMVLKFGGDLPE